MEDLSLHILDIAENSIAAGAERIEIKIIISLAPDRLTLEIKDNGKGMDEETMKMVKDPFFTTKSVSRRKKKFGLGIPLLAQTAEECGGRFFIESVRGKGTTVIAEFQKSHIDMKPLGDMGATMMTLIGGHPEIDFVFSYEKNGYSYWLDTTEIKKELDEVLLRTPHVLKLIKDAVNEALKEEA
jgi:anti-sigma regulatory factor (Ser/Thr protein kinase)